VTTNDTRNIVAFLDIGETSSYYDEVTGEGNINNPVHASI
jgi:hypothetical protein